MTTTEIVLILVIALIIGAIFYYGFKRRSPWGAFWAFLLILFLAGLAGRLWIAPAGPVFWGYGWFPLIFFIFMIALLIGISSPTDEEERIVRDDARVRSARGGDRVVSASDEERLSREDRAQMKRAAETDAEAETAGAAAAFGIFFWILILVFIGAIIAGLLRY